MKNLLMDITALTGVGAVLAGCYLKYGLANTLIIGGSLLIAYGIYDVGVGVKYNGQFYKAGMVIGAEVKNGKVETHFGVRANQFTVVNPSSGKLDPVFVIKNGQAFFNQVFIDKASINGADIQDASITMAKIADGIRSDNWPNGGWNLPKNGAFEMKGTAGGVRVALDHTGLAVFDGWGVLRVKVGKI